MTVVSCDRMTICKTIWHSLIKPSGSDNQRRSLLTRHGVESLVKTTLVGMVLPGREDDDFMFLATVSENMGLYIRLSVADYRI